MAPRAPSLSLLFAAALGAGPAGGAQILIAGDSWASGLPGREFVSMLERKGDRRTVRNIARAGSTCLGWASPLNSLINNLRTAVREDPELEHVWLICGGNDAMFTLGACTAGSVGGLPLPMKECVATVVSECTRYITNIATAVHEVNPSVRVAGFGYDLFGWGGLLRPHCLAASVALLPDCLGEAPCANREGFVKFQVAYDAVAQNLDFFDSTTLLGALQAHAGYPGASIGHPDLDRYSPPNTFSMDCIHPNELGYSVIFDAFYDKYWSHTRVAGNASEAAASRAAYRDESVGGPEPRWRARYAELMANATARSA